MNQQDPSLLKPGTRIDRYTISTVLGRGGFGITYLVRDEALNQDFALKEFFPEDLVWREGTEVRVSAKPSSESDYRWGLDKFHDEARVLAQFSHPNIVNVRRVFEANNSAYMLLDFINGSTLEKWLQRLESPPTQEELDLITTPLLSALQLAHTNRTWHLDFSPENVMIRASDGMPILLDFGAARFEIKQHSQLVSALVFKSGYSAPEQYTSSASRYGPWTDIYAFGCTLYRAIAGTRPTEATSRQLRDEQKPVAQVAKAPYRENFLQAIDWAMKLPLEERPQSIREWRRALFDTSRTPIARAIPRPSVPMTRTIPEEPRAAPPPARELWTEPEREPEPEPVAAARGGVRRFFAWVVALAGIAVIVTVAGNQIVPGHWLNPLSHVRQPVDASGCGRDPCWLAIVEKDAGVFARINGSTREEAEGAALKLCTLKAGTGCRVVAVVSKGQCWALAEMTANRGNRRGAPGATLDEAGSNATGACERAHRGTCRVEVTFCTDGTVVLPGG